MCKSIKPQGRRLAQQSRSYRVAKAHRRVPGFLPLLCDFAPWKTAGTGPSLGSLPPTWETGLRSHVCVSDDFGSFSLCFPNKLKINCSGVALHTASEAVTWACPHAVSECLVQIPAPLPLMQLLLRSLEASRRSCHA